MQYTILCDKLPKCEDCVFYQETLIRNTDKENEFSVDRVCFFGLDSCPLNELKTTLEFDGSN